MIFETKMKLTLDIGSNNDVRAAIRSHGLRSACRRNKYSSIMTVTYTAEVATCTGLGCFWKLLFRWRGSIYKLLWPNLVVYSVVYFTLSFIYRFVLSPENRDFFEKVSLHCQAYGDLIPIAFVLGFYVSIVIKRWWDQYICMPWPDNLAMFVSTLVHGQDDRGRLMRRTIIRYVNLSLVITLRMMSPRVKKRFPTLDHLVEAGFLQANEKKIFEDLDQKTCHPKYWMPLVWAGGIITRARKEGRIKDDFSMKTLIDELNIFRSGCGGMLNYDWISIPLVYTQVVTLAVYVYFMATLMANQFLDPKKNYPKHEVDLVLPIFTFLQFFFYMGWLKVAESLVNPFGEDDDDFELNWLVDRNLQVSYVIVDEMHQEHPEMVKDQYWDEVFPAELPYTAASKQYQTGPPPGSTDNVEVSDEQAEFMPLETVPEELPDDRDDMEIELDIDELKSQGSRRETHPMRILKRIKTESSGSINTCSYSGPRTGRKNSVLNMLTNLFKRDSGSTRDLASNMGSNVSLPSRRGLRCSSRLSSMSQSQAQSRTSIVRENTFQDEMFHMSDVSLCGSTATIGSHIQILPSRTLHFEGDDNESSEASQLIPLPKEKDMQKPVKDKQGVDMKVDIREDNSDAASGSSIKTFYYQEWGGETPGVDTTPTPSSVCPEFYKPPSKLSKPDWKEQEQNLPGDEAPSSDSGNTTRIVIPSSPPVRHSFSHSLAIPQQLTQTKKSRSPETKDTSLSSLSRSLQQQQSVLNMEQFPEQIITIFSPTCKSDDSLTSLPTSYSQPVFSPTVSLHSPLASTTSIVTTTPTTCQPVVTMSTVTVMSPRSSLTVLQIPPDIGDTGIEQTSLLAITRMQSPPKSEQTTTLETIIEEPSMKSELSLDIGLAAPPPVGAGPPQYIPSAAIPVPSMSPAHSNSGNLLENGYELMDTVLAPLSRRTLHDFRELEPISEHGETNMECPMTSKQEEPPDDPPSESTV